MTPYATKTHRSFPYSTFDSEIEASLVERVEYVIQALEQKLARPTR
jgi:hypothetical protein